MAERLRTHRPSRRMSHLGPRNFMTEQTMRSLWTRLRGSSSDVGAAATRGQGMFFVPILQFIGPSGAFAVRDRHCPGRIGSDCDCFGGTIPVKCCLRVRPWCVLQWRVGEEMNRLVGRRRREKPILQHGQAHTELLRKSSSRTRLRHW